MNTFPWNSSTPVTANNLNEMQNILNNNMLNLGDLIWTNSSPNTDFTAQTISLNQSLSNYISYEILFAQSTTDLRLMSTGVIPVGYGTILSYTTAVPNYRPTSVTVSGNSIEFQDNKRLTAIGTSITDNSHTIPMFVIGHKSRV